MVLAIIRLQIFLEYLKEKNENISNKPEKLFNICLKIFSDLPTPHVLKFTEDPECKTYDDSIEPHKKIEADLEISFQKTFFSLVHFTKLKIILSKSSLETKCKDLLHATRKKCFEYENTVQKECEDKIDCLRKELDELMKFPQNMPSGSM